MNTVRTAESVAIGHPDKICDQISDAILDACLMQDPHTRAAIEVVGGHGQMWVVGELTTEANIDPVALAHQVCQEVGCSEALDIRSTIVRQSSEIARGVDAAGAGDQGIMVGYACADTSELLPLEVVLARRLTQAMGARDGKAQVTVRDGTVQEVITSVCGKVEQEVFVTEVKNIVAPYLPPHQRLADVWRANPNGAWSVGGFAADTGLTGRKLAVDCYGPHIPLGGGCFSGKDGTKVDRSGAYMARRIAVDYLRARGAQEVFVHLAYAIGMTEPRMAIVTIDGTTEPVTGYDLRPRAIIEQLQLTIPCFRNTAAQGHFGAGQRWDV